jgi:hypothetical protein
MRETSPSSLTAGMGFIITGRQRNEIVHDGELTEAERAEFYCLDWPAIEAGTDSATFFRRNGDLYDLSEFLLTAEGSGERRLGWHGARGDSFFSAIIVHLDADGDFVLSALMLS